MSAALTHRVDVVNSSSIGWVANRNLESLGNSSETNSNISFILGKSQYDPFFHTRQRLTQSNSSSFGRKNWINDKMCLLHYMFLFLAIFFAIILIILVIYLNLA